MLFILSIVIIVVICFNYCHNHWKSLLSHVCYLSVEIPQVFLFSHAGIWMQAMVEKYMQIIHSTYIMQSIECHRLEFDIYLFHTFNQ
jgi:hypothetical protein